MKRMLSAVLLLTMSVVLFCRESFANVVNASITISGSNVMTISPDISKTYNNRLVNIDKSGGTIQLAILDNYATTSFNWDWTLTCYTSNDSSATYTTSGSPSITRGKTNTISISVPSNPSSYSRTVSLTFKKRVATNTHSGSFAGTQKGLTYSIAYNPGSNANETDVVSAIKYYNTALTLKDAIFTRQGYTQTGWSTKDGGAKVYDLEFEYTANAALSLFPYWTPNKYTLYYYRGAYGSGTSSSVTTNYGAVLTLNGAMFTRDGYTQSGWSNNANGESKTYDLNYRYFTLTGNTYLYPYWTPKTYALTYRPGAYGSGSDVTVQKTHDEDLTLKDGLFTRKDYVQTGWTTESGTLYALGGTISANEPTVLYPVWSKHPTGATHFALLVGINEYKNYNPDDYLAGCVNDVSSMKMVCTDYGDWNVENIVTLTNGTATLSRFRYEVATLAAMAEEGDTVLIYDSGHGGTAAVGSKDTHICVYDGNYRDAIFASDIAKFKHGVKVVVVLDTCLSAGMFKSANLCGDTSIARSSFVGNFISNVTMRLDGVRSKSVSVKNISSSEIGWIAAADYNVESADLGGGMGGFLTTLAMVDSGILAGNADLDSDGRITFNELYEHSLDVSSEYLALGFTQVAQAANTDVLSAVAFTNRYVSLEMAMDCPDLTMLTSYLGESENQPSWVGQDLEEGCFARNVVIGHGMCAYTGFIVAGPGTLSFRWRVSSEKDHDKLYLYVDDEKKSTPISGETDWATKKLTIEGTGEHEIVWLYEKDAENSEGQDCGWVDQVTWTPSTVQTEFPYKVVGGAAIITNYTGSGGAVVVPSAIDGYAVQAIGDKAFFHRSGLASVTIPSSVKSIGNYAFSSCYELATVAMSEGVVSIGDNAFSGCSALNTVQIPSSVTSIGTCAFSNCSALKAVTIPSSVASVGDRAFYSCIRLASATISKGVLNIDSNAFAGCTNLSTVALFEGVTNISARAFSDCSRLKMITIPSSVTSIGNYAFYNCSGLTNVTISEGVRILGEHVFYNCSGLTTVTIPSTVTHIGIHAFSGCSSMTSATISEGVESIEMLAFFGCSGLKTVAMPESLRSIGTSAFSCCTGLASVTIPEGVTNISEYAFKYCSAMTSLTIPSSVTIVGSSAFYGCDLLGTIYVEAGDTDRVRGLLEGSGLACTDITFEEAPDDVSDFQYKVVSGKAVITNYTGIGGDIVIPAKIDGYDVVRIGANVFKNAKLFSVVISEGIETIEDYVFASCNDLESVRLPESLTTMGRDVFNNCSKLKNIHLPSGVKKLDSYPLSCVFGYNTGLTNITVSSANAWFTAVDGVLFTKNLKELIKYPGARSDTSYTVPNSVTKIWEYAFSFSKNLCTVTIPEGVTCVGTAAFWTSGSLKSISLPNSLTTISNSAFDSCALEEVEIPEGVTVIGNGAFGGNSELSAFAVANDNLSYTTKDGVLFTKDLGKLVAFPAGKAGAYEIPDSVSVIQWDAFNECDKLISVKVPEGVSSLSLAFCNCYKLKEVSLPSSLRRLGDDAFAYCSALKMLVVPEGVTNTTCYSFCGQTFTNLTLLGRCGVKYAFGDKRWGANVANSNIWVRAVDYDYWTALLGEGLNILPESSKTIVKMDKPTKIEGLVYTGSQQTGCAGYSSCVLVSGSISATNAGDYSVALALPADTATETFVWSDDTTDNVMLNWSIAKRAITLTSASDSKTWDGTPLVNDAVTVGGAGFVAGESFSYIVTGSQTDVGSSSNTFTYSANSGTKVSNYAVAKIEGTLTVTPLPDLDSWTDDFSAAKIKADAEGLPLVVVWSNPGCAYCDQLAAVVQTSAVETWLSEAGIVSCWSVGDAEVKAFAQNSSGKYPYVAVYWNREGQDPGKELFTGRKGLMLTLDGGLAEQFTNSVDLALLKINGEAQAVTFDKNIEGVGISVEQRYYRQDAEFGTLPTPERDGYEFLGWFSDSDDGEQIEGDTPVQDGITVYAHWLPVGAPYMWTPVPKSMNITLYAQIYDKSDDTYLDADGSVLAAFDANGECRGKVAVMTGPGDSWLYQLTIGFESSGERGVTLRLWDSAAGEVVEIPASEILYSPSQLAGSLSNPIVYTVGVLSQDVTLDEGWNWISTYLTVEENDVGTFFGDFEFADDDIVKCDLNSATYYDCSWYPDDFLIEPCRAYVVKKGAGGAETHAVEGSASTDSIIVNKNWNWFGSCVGTVKTVADLRHTGGFADDDVIKGALESATYKNGNWYPSSLQLKPGVGYLAKLANGGELSFETVAPSANLAASVCLSNVKSGSLDVPEWKPVVKPGTFTVYARVKDSAGDYIEANGSLLAAFDANGECRGVCQVADGPVVKFYQLNIGVESNGEPALMLKVWNAADGSVSEINETVSGNVNDLIGTISTPVEYAVSDDDPTSEVPTPDFGMTFNGKSLTADVGKQPTTWTVGSVAPTTSAYVESANGFALNLAACDAKPYIAVSTMIGSGKSFAISYFGTAGDVAKGVLWSLRSSDDVTGLALQQGNVGNLQLRWRKTKSSAETAIALTITNGFGTAELAKPHHYLVQVSSVGVVTLYFDGQKAYSTTPSRNFATSAYDGFALGCFYGGVDHTSFKLANGAVDDFRVFTSSKETCLADAEVAALSASFSRGGAYPSLGEDATPEQIQDALEGSTDTRLSECITNGAVYNAYLDWAAAVTNSSGETVGVGAVKAADHAWFSFAVGSGVLITELPTSDDVNVEAFEPSAESGKFDFTVSVDGVTIGSEALKENLKQVFGLEGSTTLGAEDFSSSNVDITFGTPENGKVKFTAGPNAKNAGSKAFFMKVKLTP